MKGISSVTKKIKDFITRDTKYANESSKVIVVVRILILSIFIYYVANLAVDWSVIDARGHVWSVVFIMAFSLLFWMSYTLRAKTAAWVFSGSMLAFIVMNLEWFGWWIGVQHFLIVILLIIFFVGYEGYQWKMILAAATCILRMLFYYRFHSATPAYTISPLLSDYLQIINTVTVFWCISVICYVFSKDCREMEGKLVKYNEKLEKEALTDNLTGLANRRRAMDYVNQILNEDRHESLSLCMCDIDFFKRVNDTWGHECGDLVLKQIAKIFREHMKGGNMPCRWGGEEFLLLFPGYNGDEAYNIVLDIRDAVKKMVVSYEDEEIKVTMTFGVTEFDFRSDIDAAIQEADEKLYYGKNHGRDQIVF